MINRKEKKKKNEERKYEGKLFFSVSIMPLFII